MNENTRPDKQKPRPPVTLRKMPDSSFRIYGLRYHSRIHLTKEMRPWQRNQDEHTGEIVYTSWSRHEADIYVTAHGLTILEPVQS